MNRTHTELSPPVGTGSSSWIVPGRPVDVIASVRSHRILAGGIAGLITILGLLGAVSFGHAKYEAVASLRILPTVDTRLATGLDPAVIPNIDYSSFVQQQVFEIANPETIADALKQLGPDRSLWQLADESDQQAAERLLGCLNVKWIPNTFLITVSLQGTKPQGLEKIVNAVVTAYLSRQAKQELTGADSRVSLLAQRASNLQQQADAERAQLSQFAQDLGVSTFSAGAINPYDHKLTDANEALDRQQGQLIIAQAHLAALQAEESASAITDVDLNSLAQKMLLDNPDLSAQKAELTKQRESAFLQLQGLAPSHPGRPVLEREIADINAEIGLLEGKALEQARSILVGGRSAELHAKISAEQTRVDQYQRARDGLEQELAVQKADAVLFGAKYNQALAVHEQFENHLKAISDIDDRIDLLRLQTQSPGVASLELPAELPDKPEGSKRKLIFAVSIFFAAMFAVGVPTIMDLTDPHVKSSRELETILQMPVLSSTFSNAARYTDHTIRRIALSILRERRGMGTRIFVVTSVAERAGTSSLTFALANELTELGLSTVAVEANAAMPDLRYRKGSAGGSPSLLSVSNGSGNGRKLNSAIPAASTKADSLGCDHRIIDASYPLPDRIPICERQRYRRLAMSCVQEVLEQALASHDLVLMDSPPVLNSADTAMLVQNPAGVILLVRAERDRFQEVTATVQELSKLSPPVVGVVVESGRPDDFESCAQHETKQEDQLVTFKQENPQFPIVGENTSRYA